MSTRTNSTLFGKDDRSSTSSIRYVDLYVEGCYVLRLEMGSLMKFAKSVIRISKCVSTFYAYLFSELE